MANTNSGAIAAQNDDSTRNLGAADTLAHLGFGALREISALCSISLSALENPGTLHLEHIALCLEVMRDKADDIANCIDHEAEQVNLSISCPRATARHAARRARGV